MTQAVPLLAGLFAVVGCTGYFAAVVRLGLLIVGLLLVDVMSLGSGHVPLDQFIVLTTVGAAIGFTYPYSSMVFHDTASLRGPTRIPEPRMATRVYWDPVWQYRNAQALINDPEAAREILAILPRPIAQLPHWARGPVLRRIQESAQRPSP